MRRTPVSGLDAAARSARKTPTNPDVPSSCCSSLGYINQTTKSSASWGWISKVTSPSSPSTENQINHDGTVFIVFIAFIRFF